MKKRIIPFILAVILCMMQIPAFAASSEMDCSSSNAPFTMVIKDPTGGAVADEKFQTPVTVGTEMVWNDMVEDVGEWSVATMFGKDAVFTVTNNSADIIIIEYYEYFKDNRPLYYCDDGFFPYYTAKAEYGGTVAMSPGWYCSQGAVSMQFANKPNAAFVLYDTIVDGDRVYHYGIKKGETVTFQLPIQDQSLCTLQFWYLDQNGDYTTFNGYYGWHYNLMRNDAFASAEKAVLSPQNFTVDGKDIACEKYNIDGSNYFKLRDLAYVLNGTSKQFSVGWDNANNTVTIETGKPYTAVGGELTTGSDKSSTTTPSKQTIMINGEKVTDLSVYNIGGNNYFKLRDLGAYIGFDVDYNASTNTAIVTTNSRTGTVNDLYVEIVGVEDAVSDDGKPLVRICYDVTNNGAEDGCPTLEVFAYQGGVELTPTLSQYEYAYYAPNEEIDFLPPKLRPGVTIRLANSFAYNKNGEDIRFEIHDTLAEDIAKIVGETPPGVIEYISSPGNFIGAPAAPPEIKPITDPTWTDGLVGEGDMNGAYISIDSAEIIDYGDEKQFRVYVAVTNNSDKSIDFTSDPEYHLIISAYQDGISMSDARYYEYVESDHALYDSPIRPGETRLCSRAYKLRSDSPVEVEVHSLSGDYKFGGVFVQSAAPSDY